MQKDDKLGNKTSNKLERQRKKESDREIEIDSQKKDQILAFVLEWKTNKLFNYVILVEKYAFFLAKLIFSHFYATVAKD